MAARPYPGLGSSARRIRSLLAESFVIREGGARDLQDPLSFRTTAHVLGALRDALDFASERVAIELNSSQGNPVVVPQEHRIAGSANFEVLPMAQALDLARLALAPAITSSQERALKLLDTAWSGLATGLSASGGSDSGLSILGIVTQSLTAEARLLAQPVSFELTTTTTAEGIEDRMTMAPLAARRLAEMVSLGERVVAAEFVVGTQAVELRGGEPLGRGTGAALRRVREEIPFMGPGHPVPVDLDLVSALIRSNAFAATEA